MMTHLVWAKPIDVNSLSTHFVQSLETGSKALAKRLELIERAQFSINIEYFIFDTSVASRIFVEALARKKKESPNIKIRILVDYFSLSKSLDRYYSSALIEEGIEVRHYNSVVLLNLSSVTSRDHRKLITIDGQEAIVGGRNMADEYFDLAEKFNFSDRDIWIKGEIVSQIDESFEHFWNYSGTKVPAKPKKPKRLHTRAIDNDRTEKRFIGRVAKAKQFASTFDPNLPNDKNLIELRDRILRHGGEELASEPIFEIKNIRFISDGPDFNKNDHRISGVEYFKLMEEAQGEISIEVPYFYMQKEERDFFDSLKAKKIEVNLLINSKRASKEFAINYITLLQGLKFSHMGFNLFLNKGEFLDPVKLPSKRVRKNAIWGVHAKTLLVDNKQVWIGSLNMDPRSIQRLNAEMGVVIKDDDFAARIKIHYLKRLENTYVVKKGRIQNGDRAGDDPSDLIGFRQTISILKTIPLYIFENQI